MFRDGSTAMAFNIFPLAVFNVNLAVRADSQLSKCPKEVRLYPPVGLHEALL